MKVTPSLIFPSLVWSNLLLAYLSLANSPVPGLGIRGGQLEANSAIEVTGIAANKEAIPQILLLFIFLFFLLNISFHTICLIIFLISQCLSTFN